MNEPLIVVIPEDFLNNMIEEVSKKINRETVDLEADKKLMYESFTYYFNWKSQNIFTRVHRIAVLNDFLGWLQNEPDRVVEYLINFVSQTTKQLLCGSLSEHGSNELSNLAYGWEKATEQELNNEYLNWLTRIDRRLKTTNYHDQAITEAAKLIF